MVTIILTCRFIDSNIYKRKVYGIGYYSAPIVSDGLLVYDQGDGGGILPCSVRTEQRSAELTANSD